MKPADRLTVIGQYARILYTNGQSTAQVIGAATKLSEVFDVGVTLLPRWGTLQLIAGNEGDQQTRIVTAIPSAVAMNRVQAAMEAVAGLAAGRSAEDDMPKSLRAISQIPPAPTPVFALACAAGALALAVIFGLQHPAAGALIVISAGLGALLRRVLARFTANILIQPFCAALLAGIIGAAAVRLGLSTSLRLVAVCPCMILLPGPHLLDAALDFVKGRVDLGLARAAFGGLVIAAICLGLVVGLNLFGVALPVDPTGPGVSIWVDVVSAGVVVVALSTLFATPPWMLPWPVVIGMLAHGLRYAMLAVFHADLATAAFVACLCAGLVLTPIAHRTRTPFTAIGFASIVSLMPGLYIFRMASGFEQVQRGNPTALHGAVIDGITAAGIILAMSFGLIVPKLVIDYFTARAARHEASPHAS